MHENANTQLGRYSATILLQFLINFYILTMYRSLVFIRNYLLVNPIDQPTIIAIATAMARAIVIQKSSVHVHSVNHVGLP